MYNINEKVKQVRETLDKNSSKMIAELGKVTMFINHPATELLEFEIHDLSTIVLYPMTKDADQVGGEKNNVYFVGHYKLLINIRNILQDYLFELNKEFDTNYYNNIILTLIEWFSDCWDAVKNKVSLPTYISLHDSHILFDLSNKRWGKMYEQYK